MTDRDSIQPEEQRCPRCGCYVANRFACPLCAAIKADEITEVPASAFDLVNPGSTEAEVSATKPRTPGEIADEGARLLAENREKGVASERTIVHLLIREAVAPFVELLGELKKRARDPHPRMGDRPISELLRATDALLEVWRPK